MLSGVAVEGGEAEEGGGLAAAEGAEFGHVSAEAGGVDGTEAGDRLDGGVAAGERVVVGVVGQIGYSGKKDEAEGVALRKLAQQLPAPDDA